jgi:hypothetical protein
MSLDKRTSFEKIHYLLRPGKNIQRKMICEALSHISRTISLKDHTYVGFGSVYFGDFTLFHRMFGFKNMISIEADDESEKRVRFNVPFSCIDVKMGYSGEVLPTLGLSGKKVVVWLDYDYGLNQSVLNDVKIVCQAVAPGSILMVTLDHSLKDFEKEPEEDVSGKAEAFDERNEGRAWSDLLPDEKFKAKAGFNPITPLQGGLHEAYRSALGEAVKASLDRSDSLSSRGSCQFLNFHYDDGCEMMTVGYFLGGETETNTGSVKLDQFAYYRGDKDYFEINPPKLTFKEIRSLNEHMPCLEGGIATIVQDVPLSEEFVRAYRNFYQYFPVFTEVEL